MDVLVIWQHSESSGILNEMDIDPILRMHSRATELSDLALAGSEEGTGTSLVTLERT